MSSGMVVDRAGAQLDRKKDYYYYVEEIIIKYKIGIGTLFALFYRRL